MYLIAWRYAVPVQHESEFRRAYGPAGEWGEFFRSSPHYRGTQLVVLDEPGGYMTIDSWDDAASYHRFLDENRERYVELDQRFEQLTTSETLLGRGEVRGE
ncbi:MAG TPA: hypothetical protein VLB67_15740 [Acidimicrobiia bacterium]|nr:hypothetical protein [Acidimicrobiia bacterium]